MKNQSLKLIIISFSSLIHFCFCQFSSFGMELEPYNERCLSEYYRIQTVLIFELNSESPEMQLIVKSPDGKIIFQQINSTSLFSLTTQNNGFYEVCAKNMGKYKGDVILIVRSGIGANDYSSVAKSKDLEPIDFELDKILIKQPLLNHFNKISQEKQNQFGVIYKSISTRIIFYSLLMIIGMILIGVIETLYLKRFMEKRKII